MKFFFPNRLQIRNNQVHVINLSASFTDEVKITMKVGAGIIRLNCYVHVPVYSYFSIAIFKKKYQISKSKLTG